MMSKKLRVSHVIVQSVLVWDDGEELSPFENQVNPLKVPLSALEGMAEQIKNEIEELNKQQSETDS